MVNLDSHVNRSSYSYIYTHKQSISLHHSSMSLHVGTFSELTLGPDMTVATLSTTDLDLLLDIQSEEVLLNISLEEPNPEVILHPQIAVIQLDGKNQKYHPFGGR